MPGRCESLLEINCLRRIFTASPLQINIYLNLKDPSDHKHVDIELSIDESALQVQLKINNAIAAATLTTQSALDLEAPLASPNFTGVLSANGTQVCPQLTPWHTQHYDFDIIKASGLYHYESYGSVNG